MQVLVVMLHFVQSHCLWRESLRGQAFQPAQAARAARMMRERAYRLRAIQTTGHLTPKGLDFLRNGRGNILQLGFQSMQRAHYQAERMISSTLSISNSEERDW